MAYEHLKDFMILIDSALFILTLKVVVWIFYCNCCYNWVFPNKT